MVAEQLISPETQEIVSLPLPPPAEDSRFFCLTLEEARREQLFGGEVEVPISMLGNPMTPVEASTGVTLPVITSLGGRPSKHHAHFYGTTFKNGTPGQRALRCSRLQHLPEPTHANLHKVLDGTTLPANDAEAYTVTVLNCAGYIPRYGLRVTGSGITISEITDKEKRKLCRPKAFIMEGSLKSQADIGRFLMDYALEGDFDEGHQSHVEEFLAITPARMREHEKLRKRKLRLGVRLANVALGVALDPVDVEYRRAREEQALKKGVPGSAWEFVKGLINGHEVHYLSTLEANLQRSYGLAA